MRQLSEAGRLCAAPDVNAHPDLFFLLLYPVPKFRPDREPVPVVDHVRVRNLVCFGADGFRCCEGDLGFLFARRGLGKTWLALAIAKGASEGSECGPWKAGTAAGVLLVDGEMPPELIQDRTRALAMASERLTILNHELLFERSGLVLNLTDANVQNAITEICVKLNTRLLVLDNLSCLFRGVDENNADDWEQILPWLLDLRFRDMWAQHDAPALGSLRSAEARTGYSQAQRAWHEKERAKALTTTSNGQASR